MLQGEKIESIHLRRSDEFQDLVALLNQLIEQCHQDKNK
jgi:hypothetical protein